MKNLFIFEMANNHMGDVSHGLRIIRAMAKVKEGYEEFDFAIKFQLRNVDTFIHPDYKHRMELKYVKRFSETRLTDEDFLLLKTEAENHGFIPICTGFDEASVSFIEKVGFPIIKIASCSFTDWPLLTKITETSMPIIASTAGATLQEIDNVVKFFTHRDKDLTIMHCVGEYPTQTSNLQLNQIDFLKKRYPNVRIGYSTHEDPNNSNIISLAIAKGAQVFEKHVAVETNEYVKNAYSATPEQVSEWLHAARTAIQICGSVSGRPTSSEKEHSDLRRFKRGVFAKRKIKKGEVLDINNVFFAFPCQDSQLLANNMSKYVRMTAKRDFNTNESINLKCVEQENLRKGIYEIIYNVKTLLREANVVVPGKADLEISHHYGVENFYETGITMITVVNREYCKKIIIVLPGQSHPEQYHRKKEETFVVLHGNVELFLDGERLFLEKGGVFTILPGVKHSFTTTSGCVIEEISSTHYKDDSYYTDERISQNKNRKTIIADWLSQ